MNTNKYKQILTSTVCGATLLFSISAVAKHEVHTRSGYGYSDANHDIVSRHTNVIGDFNIDYQYSNRFFTAGNPHRYRGSAQKYRAYRYHHRPHYRFSHAAHPYHHYRHSVPHRTYGSYRQYYGQPYHKHYYHYYRPYYDYDGYTIPRHILRGGHDNDLYWSWSSHGRAPQGAVVGSYENEREIYICRAPYKHSMYLGKVVGKGCMIYFRGNQVVVPRYKVLLAR